MDNQTQVSIKFINSVTGEKKLEKYSQQLQLIKSVLDGMNVGQAKEIDKSASNLNKVNNEVNQIGGKVKLAFNIGAIKMFSNSVYNAVKSLAGLTKASSDYIENVNLLEVAYKRTNQSVEESSASVKEFVSTMSEVYGFDESRLTKTLGIFKQLANAMQLPTDVGENLSEMMVKMSNDISSLYNIDLSRSESALQSALVGQVRPIRGASGADITESTLQQTLDQLSIDRNIRDLSFAEKRLIMVVSLSKQLKVSQGDYARTIESTSNQIRVFGEQWSRLSRAVGNVFFPILQKILPYINAVFMVLTEIFNLVSSLLGFKMPEFDYSGLAGTSDATNDLIEGMDDAGASADELSDKMKGLRGFDKLNVINTQKDDKNSSTGIDSNILDAFNKSFSEYDDMLSDVKMKATDIRDSILEWLGFTDGTYKNLKLIGIIMGAIVGTKLLGFIGGLITGSSRLGKILGTGGLYTALKNFFTLCKEGTVISTLTTKLAPLTTFFTNLGGAVTGAFTAVATALGISVGWVVLIAVAIVALIATIVIFHDQIGAFFSSLWDNIYKSVITPIVEFFTSIADFIYKNMIQPIIDFMKPIVEAIGSVVGYAISKVWEIVSGIGEAIVVIIKKIGEIFLKIVEILVALGKAFYNYVIEPILEFIGKIANWVYEKAIKPILDVFAGIGGWIYDKLIAPLISWITWVKDRAVDIFKEIGITVINFMSDTFKSVINGILWVIESSINGFIRLLNGAIDLINKIPDVKIKKVSELNIPRLEKGMNFVPKDYFGPVYLDYGERVLTKDENARYNSNSSSIPSNSNNSSSNEAPINTTIIIQVGDEELGRKVIKDLKKVAKNNGKPIVIGG